MRAARKAGILIRRCRRWPRKKQKYIFNRAVEKVMIAEEAHPNPDTPEPKSKALERLAAKMRKKARKSFLASLVPLCGKKMFPF